MSFNQQSPMKTQSLDKQISPQISERELSPYLNKQQHSNNSTTTGTSFSSSDIELKHLENLKHNLTIITKQVEKNLKSISNIDQKNKQLKLQKEKSKTHINNLISQKESLEELITHYITEYKVNFKDFYFEQKVTPLMNNIFLSSKNKLKEQISNFLFELNIKCSDNKMSQIEKIIEMNGKTLKLQLSNPSLNSKQIVNNYFNVLSQEITDVINCNMIYQEQINYNIFSNFLKYFVKINSLNQQVENEMMFINKQYKEEKHKNKSVILDLKIKNIKNENIKKELTKQINDLNSKIESQLRNSNITSRSYRNNNDLVNNHSDCNYFVINQPPSKPAKRNHHKSSSLDNNINNKLSTYSYIKNNTSLNLIPIKKVNNENEMKNKNKRNSLKTKQFNNNDDVHLYYHCEHNSCYSFRNMNNKNGYNDLVEMHINNNLCYQGESFCYFKILFKNEHRFNPLLSNCNSSSPETLGYFKGFISLDFENETVNLYSKLKKQPNSNNLSSRKNYNLYQLKIKINKINSIVVQSLVKDIIKIHRIYLKQSNMCRNNPVNLNEFIYMQEFKEIKLDSNDKIKSALCKYFPFCIVCNNFKERLEIIFTNYDDFKNWLNILRIISNGNSNTYINGNFKNK